MPDPTRFNVVQADAFIGPIAGGDASPFGKVWYVDGTLGSNGNTGDSPDQAFATITQAIAASRSGKGDLIVIAPGTYSQSAALAPKARTTFRAAVVNQRIPSVKISITTADGIQLDVDGVRFIGVEFLGGSNTADNLVDIADGAAVAGAEFFYCTFNGADRTSLVGINANDASFAVTGLVVKNCLFRDLTGTCINIGALGFAYSDIEANQFAIDVNSGVGIALADTTAFATGKGYRIVQNDFTGFDATADEVGITIAGTEDTTGAGIIRNNFFAYMAAAAVTIDKLSKSEVQNYYGDAATGGTLVDPGT